MHTDDEPRPILTDEQAQVLLDEAQRLQTLYLDARNGAMGSTLSYWAARQ